MGVFKNNLLLISVFAVLSITPVFSQVVFRDYPAYQFRSSDHIFFDVTTTRSIILLNGDWQVNTEDEKTPAVTVKVPSVFEGEGKFIFQKNFTLTADQIRNYLMEIVFTGINYTADISVNDVIIYRHGGGEYPFTVNLPRDILREGSDNTLIVNLTHKLDSKNTIPLKQRFLFPQNFGGITGDVYIHLVPNIYVAKNSISSTLNDKQTKAELSVKALIKNKDFKRYPDSVIVKNEFIFKSSILDEAGEVVGVTRETKFTLEQNKEESIEHSFKIIDPVIWSPENPHSYLCRFEIWKEDSLIDITTKVFSLYKFNVADNAITLNGREYQLNGVTYVPSNNLYGRLLSYDQLEKDIILIKDAGFNSVRIAKSVPHPYLLRLCEQYGLLAFIELPVNIVPPSIAQDESFITRCKNYINNYLDFYNQYPAFAGLGLGTSFLPRSESHIALINNLAAFVKERSDVILYASFSGFNISKIDNLDLYGLELINQSVADYSNEIVALKNNLGAGRVIITEAAYSVSKGSTDGYVNEHSYEAQAKYFEDLLDYSAGNKIAALFINTMIDYRGDYSSLISGYNPLNVYNIGIIGEDRSTNRLAYKVINAKLHNLERVTIPIGSKKDDAPMVFIVYGLILALFMGVLVNSGRKFREDASRALLRPYNFFADVRDQRIISAYHTTLLGLIIAAVSALILANMIYYLKDNRFFEMLLLSFGSPAIIKAANFLAWHPLFSILWLTIGGIFLLLLLALFIKGASLFIKGRVYLISLYFMIIWALLPLVLLIPLGIILYRVLAADVINAYLYIAFLIVALWVLYRLLKGIFVLFDASQSSVYFYSILCTIAIVGGVLFYFELKNAAFQYIIYTLNQFGITG